MPAARPRSLARLAAVPTYRPGKPIEEVRRELGLASVVKLASNENPLGPSPKAQAALRRQAGLVHRYPEGGAPLLRRRLSRMFRLPEDHFIFGNGSNELLVFAAQAFAGEGDKVVFSDRSFAVYAIATALAGAVPVPVPSPDFEHDLEGLAKAARGASVLYVCNPNNPTGSWHSDRAIEKFLSKVHSRTLVVLDVAYAEYAGHAPSVDARWVRRFDNLLVTRTFAKAYGLAGLRLGYGIARPWLVRELERCRQPFNTNAMAQAAALAALDDRAFVRRSLRANLEGLKQVRAGLQALGLRALPSRANFIQFAQPAGPAPDGLSWFDWLLLGGVVVRPVEQGWLRVTSGLKAENARFLRRLRQGMEP
ncbi:MAG TPA: histidinol-phosphate transaminase [bacterium]|nr:histidinol-phosphate transaminase [bacterium]